MEAPSDASEYILLSGSPKTLFLRKFASCTKALHGRWMETELGHSLSQLGARFDRPASPVDRPIEPPSDPRARTRRLVLVHVQKIVPSTTRQGPQS